MFKFTPFIALILFCNTLFAQNEIVVDSLLQIAKSATSKEKVNLYIKIASEYKHSDSSNTIRYAYKAIKLAEKVNYIQGKVDALFEIAWMNMQRGYYTKSRQLFIQVLQDAKLLKYKRGETNGLNGLGVLNDYQGNYSKALKYHFKVIKIRKEIKDRKGLSSSYHNVGNIYSKQGNYEKASKYHFKAFRIIKEIGDKKGLLTSYISLGIIYSKQANYSKALKYHFKALETAKKLGDKGGISFSYNNIGDIYDNQGSYKKALDYYYKSLKIKKELGDKRRISTSYNNIGVVYLKQNNYSKALKYHFKAMRIRKVLGDKDKMCSSHNNIGNVYLKQEKYEKALYHFFKSLNLAEAINNKVRKSTVLIGIGTVYSKQKRWKLAKQYLTEALYRAQKIGLPKNICKTAQELAQVEKELGNYKAAYEAHLLFKQMADSLQNEEQTRTLTRLELEYRFKQEKNQLKAEQKLQNSQKEAENTGLRLQIYLSIFGIIFISLIAICLTYYYFNQKKTNKKLLYLNTQVQNQQKELERKNDRLQSLNDEKNLLIGVVAHDLKTPINQVQSLIGLIETNLEENNPAELPQLLTLMKQASKSQKNLINRILDIEAIEKQSNNSNWETLDSS